MNHDIKIRQAAADKGWTITRLAREVGVKPSTLDGILRKKPQQFDTAIRIARKLGVQAEWLYDEKLDYRQRPAPLAEEAVSELLRVTRELLAVVERIAPEHLELKRALEALLPPAAPGGRRRYRPPSAGSARADGGTK